MWYIHAGYPLWWRYKPCRDSVGFSCTIPGLYVVCWGRIYLISTPILFTLHRQKGDRTKTEVLLNLLSTFHLIFNTVQTNSTFHQSSNLYIPYLLFILHSIYLWFSHSIYHTNSTFALLSLQSTYPTHSTFLLCYIPSILHTIHSIYPSYSNYILSILHFYIPFMLHPIYPTYYMYVPSILRTLIYV